MKSQKMTMTDVLQNEMKKWNEIRGKVAQRTELIDVNLHRHHQAKKDVNQHRKKNAQQHQVRNDVRLLHNLVRRDTLLVDQEAEVQRNRHQNVYRNVKNAVLTMINEEVAQDLNNENVRRHQRRL